MGKTLLTYCAELGDDRLLMQWHRKKNTDISPETVSIGSHKKVWWLCERGHEWQSPVYSRTSGYSGCPVCTGKTVLQGSNDLTTTHPQLAKQWHPDKNNGLTPEDVTSGSHKKMWWICEKGHEWKAQINSRSSGTGCPVCSNRLLVPGVNDLGTTHPDIAAQWHPTKNGTLKPKDIIGGTRRRFWWMCEKGHEWEAAVFSRTTNSCGCPYCSGRLIIPGETDLASNYPKVAEQWVFEKNGELTPETVSAYSNRKAWWKCERGHEYSSAVCARTMHGSGCPYCAGRKVLKGFNDLATVYPLIAAQWYEPLNAPLTAEQVTPGSRKKVWWQCSDGHVWKAVISSRTGPRKHGCPVCAGKTPKSHGQRNRSLASL